MQRLTAYFARLADGFGEGWTRFWFTPSDSSTVSAIRLLIGAVVVYWHATLALDLTALFGPDGLLPATEIAPLEGGTWSYLNLLSTPGELWTVHLLGLAVLLLFTAGWWTRITTILALIVFLSDVNRAPMITSLTEPVAAMVLLYLCLAPCGARFSIDAWLARRRTTAISEPPVAGLSTMTTIATRLIQVHLALLVAMMGFSQLGGEPWWNGSGIWWLMARPESRLVDFTGLYASPMLIDAWTHLIVLFELSFPMLIWIRLARPMLLALAAVVWGSLALVTGDIPFALTLMIASLAFVSPDVFARCCVPRTAA